MDFGPFPGAAEVDMDVPGYGTPPAEGRETKVFRREPCLGAEDRVRAVDMAAGVGRIVVLIDHADKSGRPKFRRSCTLPVTGTNVLDMIIARLSILRRETRRAPFTRDEIVSGITPRGVRGMSEALYQEAGQ